MFYGTRANQMKIKYLNGYLSPLFNLLFLALQKMFTKFLLGKEMDDAGNHM